MIYLSRWFAIGAAILCLAGQTLAALNSNTTVFIILMENHNWSQIHGSSSAPYINNTLLPIASRAEQYYNPPGLHPSLPNYIWLESGDSLGISDDNDPSANHKNTTDHLVTYLKNAGISWRSYQEDISAGSCPLTHVNNYYPKHNPMIYFDDVVGNPPSTSSTTCIANVRPYSEFANDLANNTVARYNFITPQQCNDMHDSCAPVNDSIRQGDNWLAANVPAILNSQAYQNGGVLIITWDEGSGSDGPIGMIVLSPFAKGGGYSNNIHYTHSSTLRTLQEIYNVRPFLRDAANATDLSDLFVSGAITNTDPFVMDGLADSTNFVQNAGPMVIYAAVRGTQLYVATWSPGANNTGANDHFVIVTDQLSSTLQAAFPAWSKTGQNSVDPAKPYLSGESASTYVAWQNTAASTTAFKPAATSGLMEGTIDLVQTFGAGVLTGKVYIAAAAYGTANGGALVAQGPPGNGNGNIESNEFLAVTIGSIRDDNRDGVYDAPPTPPATPTNVLATAISYNRIDVSWAASSGATSYNIRRGGLPVGTSSSTTYSDTGLLPSTLYCYTVSATNIAGASAESSPAVCTMTQTAPPFILDGTVDSTNYLENTGPMIIYAAVKGTTLYVATWSPGSNNNGVNDHFILVTDQLSPTLQAAFPGWSKTGLNGVDSGKPFLSGESINDYVGWQNTAAATQAFKTPTNAGLLEGTIDLVQTFGPNIMTGTVYVAAAAYSTTNGGALVAQGPPGNGDANIDTNEFLALPIAAMLDNSNDGIFDRLQPGLDFITANFQPAGGGGFRITWASVPGKAYQIQYTGALEGGWSDLPGGQVTGAAGQIFTSFTDSSATTQRFYRVKY